MPETEKPIVLLGKGGQKDLALAIAKRVGTELSERPGSGLALVVDASGVTLTGYGLSFRGDFTEAYSRVADGKLQHEMLVHVAKTKTEHPRAVDATAGMGTDSFLLAAYGYDVTMYEQNPVVAALLKDAMRRARKDARLAPIIDRMHLVEGNSIELLPSLSFAPELIYLDPMFPARQKSGLINKKLQLIQKLEHPCVEEEALFAAALAANPQKIVVKRPLKGEVLAGREAQYSVKGKAIRYDCFVFSQQP